MSTQVRGYGTQWQLGRWRWRAVLGWAGRVSRGCLGRRRLLRVGLRRCTGKERCVEVRSRHSNGSEDYWCGRWQVAERRLAGRMADEPATEGSVPGAWWEDYVSQTAAMNIIVRCSSPTGAPSLFADLAVCPRPL